MFRGRSFVSEKEIEKQRHNVTNMDTTKVNVLDMIVNRKQKRESYHVQTINEFYFGVVPSDMFHTKLNTPFLVIVLLLGSVNLHVKEITKTK